VAALTQRGNDGRQADDGNRVCGQFVATTKRHKAGITLISSHELAVHFPRHIIISSTAAAAAAATGDMATCRHCRQDGVLIPGESKSNL